MTPPNLGVELAGVKLVSPVMSASGCFASGQEMSEFIDIGRLGAVVVKSMTLSAWPGKPTPRMAETPSGLLNAIGLQNKGVEGFIEQDLPWLRSTGVPVIVSIAGNTVEEFRRVADRLDATQGIAACEVNISCPNLEDRSKMFAHDAKATGTVIAAVRRALRVPVFAKLSPNVTSIVEIAGAALEAGAHGLSLINTVLGMSIDPDTGHPKVAGIFGGLSGPAIRPIAVRCVYEVHRVFPHIPIIGMGGAGDYRDVVEFLRAGASAVAIGTANFVNPRATTDAISGLERFLREHEIDDVGSLVGQVIHPDIHKE